MLGTPPSLETVGVGPVMWDAPVREENGNFSERTACHTTSRWIVIVDPAAIEELKKIRGKQ